MSDDSLRDLLGAGRRRKTQESRATADEDNTESSKGLNPLDLLSMPEAQRDVINWLSRQSQASLTEIQTGLGKDADYVRGVVNELKQSGAIHEALVNGEVFYRVVYKAKVGRVSRGLPQDFWSRLDLDNTAFLRQIGLFQGLSDEQLGAIAGKLEARTYQRSEVILWQGEVVESLFFIKSGIVNVSRISPKTREAETLAYLREGDMLGEYSLLAEQNRTTTATATAMSEVTILVMSQKDFYDLLQNYRSAAIELSRMLVQRILDSNMRRSATDQDTKVSLVFGVDTNSGATTVGSAVAMTLAAATERPSVYTEYPYSIGLVREFGFQGEHEAFKHAGGYDVFVHRESLTMPPTVRVTLLMDQLTGSYGNIVIGLPPEINDAIYYMLERADQIIIVTQPTESAWQKVELLHTRLQEKIHPEKTSVFIVVNQRQPSYIDAKPLPHADATITYDAAMPALDKQTINELPESLAKAAGMLADRLGRNNQISVYIPTTVDVNQTIDTTAYVQKTLAFLGKRFGGATSSQAQGVWNSEDSGLVSETVHIVRSYTTQAALDKYLADVMGFMEELKQDLKQEAMAIEINQKLILI